MGTNGVQRLYSIFITMHIIKALRNTVLTKLPTQSSDPGNQVSKVESGRIMQVESFGETIGSKMLVNFAHGAGTWFIYLPHWQLPNLKLEKSKAEGKINIAKEFPNNRQGNIDRIVATCKEFNCLKNQAAYILATARWETNNTFMPVKEAYWLSEAWRLKNLRYSPYYGRGFVQLTWDYNYKYYEDLLGLPLVKNPNLVMDPDVSAFILVHGSMKGVFTTLPLTKYVNKGKSDFLNARRVINGMDKAQEIKNIAESWYNGQTLSNYEV